MILDDVVSQNSFNKKLNLDVKSDLFSKIGEIYIIVCALRLMIANFNICFLNFFKVLITCIIVSVDSKFFYKCIYR